ncbi:nuclease-related domain-containing protein [Alicyclobacillus dauci]|uniref:NERD domain-containing protein n=1 Tax=Alicyclobacillus dauci TaxID=1475485 RepID=A0ABY6ZAB3_9BACL|nr:nuclease-related domain-containing protein [Alicyclobacillus dauci]WAH39035.1 NERD domain-containing protein [Alicyclobacillus dauci]
MFEKIVSIFKKPNKVINQASPRNTRASQSRRTVDPTHIGDLGEYKIDVQLRQFSNEYRYLSDLLLVYPRSKTGYSQVDHLLITPYALFVIETKNYQGYVRGKREDRNWRVNGKYNMYNPVQQNRTHINALKRVLKEYKDIRFVSVISFTKRCDLRYLEPDLREVESDEFVVYDVKLTEYIKRTLAMLKRDYTDPPLADSDIKRIFELLIGSNITDPKIRIEHNQKAEEVKVTNKRE